MKTLTFLFLSLILLSCNLNEPDIVLETKYSITYSVEIKIDKYVYGCPVIYSTKSSLTVYTDTVTLDYNQTIDNYLVRYTSGPEYYSSLITENSVLYCYYITNTKKLINYYKL